MTSNDEFVLEVLEEDGLVDDSAIEQVAEDTLADGSSIVDRLIEQQFIEEIDVLQAVASRFGMEVINLQDETLEADIISEVPADVARRYKVVPVCKVNGTLMVALDDPLDMGTLDSLRFILKCDVQGVVAPRSEITEALRQHYDQEASVESLLGDDGEGVDVAVSGDEELIEEVADDSDAPIIKLVGLIIMNAFRNRASDIHVEPMEKRLRVRYRIDGVLHEVDSPPQRLQSAILSRIKIMAQMKIAERRVPQDGRIQMQLQGRELDLRVSTVPSSHGESIVMRILDKQSLSYGLPSLGFMSDDQSMFERLIALPDGIILVTGPTGSGKTTTLYACLNHINKPDRKIITVEDPVEYQLTGINQVHVKEDIGLTFSSALRAILRQAPNIVMIGEIRDMETANIATEASLTGHLVFSTLHTNDAPSAVSRLLDIGVKPFLVASSLRAVMAQRLIREICEGCKEEYTPSRVDVDLLGEDGKALLDSSLIRGRGCNACSLTGYTGRKGIFEIFVVSDSIQKLIYQEVSSREIRHAAREAGMRTLREDGVRKIIAGITTVEEVLRVTMGDEE